MRPNDEWISRPSHVKGHADYRHAANSSTVTNPEGKFTKIEVIIDLSFRLAQQSRGNRLFRLFGKLRIQMQMSSETDKKPVHQIPSQKTW